MFSLQCLKESEHEKLTQSRRWSTNEQRAAYIQAVQCLHETLVQTLPNIPGSRNRIDDFVAVHLQQGYNVEFTGIHLHWHRIFLHLFAQALRHECGYKGSLMYWDFSEYSDDISKDPIFSANSSMFMGGDGAPIPGGHGAVMVDYFGRNISVPPGAGGGCLEANVLEFPNVCIRPPTLIKYKLTNGSGRPRQTTCV